MKNLEIYHLAFLIPILLTFTIYFSLKATKKKEDAPCVKGKVTEVKIMEEGLSEIEVEYCVDNRRYRIKENIEKNRIPLKLSEVRVGLRSFPKAHFVEKGDWIPVYYDKKRPEKISFQC